jgi:hypothetical protein
LRKEKGVAALTSAEFENFSFAFPSEQFGGLASGVTGSLTKK